MCGIVGGFWSAPNDSDVVEERLSLSLGALSHRGPDDNGIEIFDIDSFKVGFGHARLSIIDLTSSGHQPMYSDNKNHVLVFNGEIYNYIELKEELISEGVVFKTNTDTEVLLEAWIRWKEKCLNKLIGMFAFVVYDFEEQTAYCCRDAFGIKPFYYSKSEKGFFFSSEIESISELVSSPREVNLQRAYDYLVFGEYDSNEETFLNGINQLLPAQLLKLSFKNNKIVSELSLWWEPEKITQRKISFEDATKLVREEFLRSVKLHLRADVPLGVALSGGLDSSAVVCAIRHLEPNASIHTFSYIADCKGLSEEKWVDRVNAFVNAVPNKVSASSGDMAIDLDEMIKAQGEPFGSTSIYAQYRVFQLAKSRGITVSLDGQGADELLAGYDGYPEQRLMSLISRGKLLSAISFLKAWATWPKRDIKIALMKFVQVILPDAVYKVVRARTGTSTTPPWLKHEYLLENGVSLKEKRRAFKDGKSSSVTSYLKAFLNKRTLPALLRHADRNSMRFTIESRVPFLTVPLAELLLSFPEEYLISNAGETKHIFRHAMHGIVPDEIIFRRDKIGFETPEENWLYSMSDKIHLWLSEAVEIPFIDAELIKSEFDKMLNGEVKFSWQLWRWINFIRWYRLFIMN